MFPFLFKGIDVKKLHCDVCVLAKHRRASFSISNKKVSIPFALVHSDIWGLATISNISGSRWFISFMYDCTRITWVFLLKQTLDVSTLFPYFHKMVKTQFGVGIKKFRSDNANDYFNQVLSSYFQKEDIIHESSYVSTLQQMRLLKEKIVIFLLLHEFFCYRKMFPNHIGESSTYYC